MLEDEGYSSMGVPNGQRALDLLDESQEMPRVILLDLMMPEMDGWECRPTGPRMIDNARVSG